MLLLGDARADDPQRRSTLLDTYRAVDPDVALQTGDLQCYDLPEETYFVAGNHENLDVVTALRDGERPPEVDDVHLLAGDVVDLKGTRIAGLPGTYAPTQYDRDRSDLSGERRRHFTHEDVERVRACEDVDLLLTHEAPHGLLEVDGNDVGCRPVDDLIRALEPDLCVVGHHHEHAESRFGPCRVVSLRPVWEGYYTLDPDGLGVEAHEPPR